ncbi:dihydroxy-acid dehydratase [Streptomonospora arabica]|uniref:Dihydroxy-acid dehydratase n=1 Tax=Streptomonospora arabica TaxID=412417 RepID=A0ABV9SML9_9ACTN
MPHPAGPAGRGHPSGLGLDALARTPDPPRMSAPGRREQPGCARFAPTDDPELDVDADTVLVLRNCGPAGYPGMPEVSNVALPSKLLAQGVSDMVRICDGRMSGTAYGTVVLHTAPEAAVGGPLALVRDGDEISLDVPARTLTLHVDDAELERRRAEWAAPRPGPRAAGGRAPRPRRRAPTRATATSPRTGPHSWQIHQLPSRVRFAVHPGDRCGLRRCRIDPLWPATTGRRCRSRRVRCPAGSLKFS